MLRVLHILGHLQNAGAEMSIMNYYRHLDNTQVQFDFFLYASKKKHGVDKYFFEDEATQLGANIYHHPVHGGFNPITNPGFAKKMFEIFKEDKNIKIVHIHIATPRAAAVVAMVARVAGIKVRIVQCHSVVTDLPFSTSVFKPLLRRAASHWMACSTEAGRALFGEKAWDKSKRTYLMLNARKLEEFRLDQEKRSAKRRELSIDTKLVAISVARLSLVKNITFLLDVFSHLLRKHSNAVLLIAGEGHIEGELKNKAKELGIENSVNFLGLRSDVPELLFAADVYAMPSIREGLPGAAIEAQAAGLPCLLSDTISKETKVTENVQFLPINQGVDEWAEAIIKLKDFKRRDTYEDVRQAGYEIADAAKKLQEFYLQAVKK